MVLLIRHLMESSVTLAAMGLSLIYVPIIGIWAIHKFNWQHWEPFDNKHDGNDHLTRNTIEVIMTYLVIWFIQILQKICYQQKLSDKNKRSVIAQFGSAPVLGTGGRRNTFESLSLRL